MESYFLSMILCNLSFVRTERGSAGDGTQLPGGLESGTGTKGLVLILQPEEVVQACQDIQELNHYLVLRRKERTGCF